jgi:hypothetical protein
VGVARARELKDRPFEVERARFDRSYGCAELTLKRGDFDATVGRGVRREPAAGLLELALAPDPVSAAGLVPRDCDVHEALQEVALGRLGCAPGVLELLVGGEELACTNQLEAAFERVRRRP